MIKSVRVMLRPNNKQRTKLKETADAARHAYNWTVALQMATFEETGKYLSDKEVRRLFTQYKQEKAWLYNVSNDALKQTIKDACKAFWRFIVEKKKPGYHPYSKKQIERAKRLGKTLTRYDMQHHPKYKKKNEAQPKFYVDTDKIEFSETHVQLEKIANGKRKNRAQANWIKLAEEGRVPLGVSYTNPRVTYDGINWWISVGVEYTPTISYPKTSGVGIDVGISKLADVSNESVYQNINKTQTIRKMKKKQRRLQRQISRKYLMNKEGDSYEKTSNIIKSEEKLLRINQRLNGIRHDHVHQTTSKIVGQKPSFICMEDLNVQGMMKNKHLAKAIQEQCWYEFSRQIEYKCDWNGIDYLEADRYYPSSKMCSCCGNIKKDLKLSDRVYVCEECGLVIDRDHNASLNLEAYGLDTLKEKKAG